jgi:hypothetical protein
MTEANESDTTPADGAFDAASDLRARVEWSLHTRSAPSGTIRARTEELVKTSASRVWTAMKRRPSLGVLAATAAGLALASSIGVGELAIGIVAGYAAYQVLAQGVPPKDAARQVAQEVGKLVD